MLIRRMQVEEGFLDGLDLQFSEDLNIFIGGRGVGKTSIIELIRFCLGLEGVTQFAETEALEHALNVLGSGQVTVTLEDVGATYQITRSASDEMPRGNIDFEKPILLSQTEVESLGIHPDGRLSLLDSFLSAKTRSVQPNTKQISKIRSRSLEIRNLNGEIEELSEALKSLSGLKESHETLKKQQKDLSSAEIDKSQNELNILQKEVNRLSVSVDLLNRNRNLIFDWSNHLDELTLDDMVLESWPIELGSDPISNLREAFSRDIAAIKPFSRNALKYLKEIDDEISAIKEKRVPLDEGARVLRKKIDSHKQGAGKISREIGLIGEKIARLESMEKLVKEKNKKLGIAHKDRGGLLKELEEMRDEKFIERARIEKKLNSALKPTIRIDIKHLANFSEYEEQVKSVLRGSNLRYNEIAPIIAATLSPSEVAELSQANDYVQLAEILDISLDRSARLLAVFREGTIENILTAKIEDDVIFSLLDGVDYKPIDQLSIGQRCTVVLSIVLENLSKILIIDQPEDHLDNQFVAETLIRAINARNGSAQTILSSHNANIPVLGNASKVAHLESNGMQGFIRNEGTLDDSSIVEAIINVMEGGEEAFRLRAEFYAKNKR